MVFKLVKTFTRSVSKGHYSVLPADTFAGRIIPKSRFNINKDFLRESKPDKYGGRYVVTMLPGASPGPKLMSYVKNVFQVAHVPVDFEEILSSDNKDEKEIAAFEHSALTSMHRNGAGIKGNIVSSNVAISSNVALRQELDLYVSVVHVKGYPDIKCKYPNLDIYICRQNTEGEYAMLEHEAKPGVVESMKIITEENTSRFADWCFRFAKQEKRKKVTIVHKANIMKLSDGLFMKVVKEVSKSYPDIQINDMIIDNASMQLVQDPSQFDVIVTPNLYGNILSNIACGLTGGAGLMSGRNYGPCCALFESGARHLTYLDEHNVNPIAMINASKDLLNYIGHDEYADLIEKAVIKTLTVEKIQTSDIGGSHSSDDVVDSIKKNIKDLQQTTEFKQF